MCCSIDTTCEHTCNRCCSVDAGFILALPLFNRDLELDTVGVSTKDHVAILAEHGHGWGGGPICEIKILVQELRLKM